MRTPFSKICGGITAPQGFIASSSHGGIKEGNKRKPDVALIYSDQPAVAAGTFTTNKVKAAPVRVSMAHLGSRKIHAIVANSGNANACTGVPGILNAKRMTRAAAKALGVGERQVLVCSTGRIGVDLPIVKVEKAIAAAADTLRREGSLRVARAIMTSDTYPKQAAVQLRIEGKTVRIGGVAKGAGMIDPNMATMLCFITTDAVIGKRELRETLAAAVEQSFNRITVDGDMSTNDTVLALANGLAGNAPIRLGGQARKIFQAGLNDVTNRLARMIVEDGEGVTKFIEVQVKGAATYRGARAAAEAVAKSSLVKCAWFGGDPNWGRIMGAIGYSGARLREEMVDIYYDGVIAVKNGMKSKTPFSKLRRIAGNDHFTLTIDLHLGAADYTVYTTDLTSKYVEFNKGE